MITSKHRYFHHSGTETMVCILMNMIASLQGKGRKRPSPKQCEEAGQLCAQVTPYCHKLRDTLQKLHIQNFVLTLIESQVSCLNWGAEK